MVNLEPIGEISDSGAALISMSDYDDLVATVNELGRDLIYMTFDSSRLGEEEVADHGNLVRHFDMDVFLSFASFRL